jgi:hypothetical protein
MVVPLAESSDALDEWEELRERYEDGVAEHEALVVFLLEGLAGGTRPPTDRIGGRGWFVSASSCHFSACGRGSELAHLLQIHRTEISLIERGTWPPVAITA